MFDVELPEKGVSLNESAFTVPGPSLVAPVQTPIGKVSSPHCQSSPVDLASSHERRGLFSSARIGRLLRLEVPRIFTRVAEEELGVSSSGIPA